MPPLDIDNAKARRAEEESEESEDSEDSEEGEWAWEVLLSVGPPSLPSP